MYWLCICNNSYMYTNPAPTARERLVARIDALSLDQASAALLELREPKSEEHMLVRVSLIASIERRFPPIAAWLTAFYDGDDDAPCWSVDYPDAILLARSELGI